MAWGLPPVRNVGSGSSIGVTPPIQLRGEVGGGAGNRLSTLICNTMTEFFTLGCHFLKVIILRMHFTFAFVYNVFKRKERKRKMKWTVFPVLLALRLLKFD